MSKSGEPLRLRSAPADQSALAYMFVALVMLIGAVYSPLVLPPILASGVILATPKVAWMAKAAFIAILACCLVLVVSLGGYQIG